MLQTPKGFLREVLWPELEALNSDRAEVAVRILRKDVHDETREAEERDESRRLS